MQKELDGRYQEENVQFFGVSTGDPDWYLRELKKQWTSKFPWLMLNINLPNPYYLELFETWKLSVLYPTLVILDSEGLIRFRASGLHGTDDDEINLRGAFDLIDTLLQEAKGKNTQGE